jgi:hypothetical protein
VNNSGRGRVSREVEGERIRSMYFIYLYENRTMNSIGIVLSRGVEDEGK